MSWKVYEHIEFLEWRQAQEPKVQTAIKRSIEILAQGGPTLGRPQVDTIKGSAMKNLKELRVQCGGEPYRILFAFDPKRRALVLVGGNKTGDSRWYERNTPIAEKRYAELQKELDEKE